MIVISDDVLDCDKPVEARCAGRDPCNHKTVKMVQLQSITADGRPIDDHEWLQCLPASEVVSELLC